MKKKIISLLLVLALCLGMTFSVSAEDAEGFAKLVELAKSKVA